MAQLTCDGESVAVAHPGRADEREKTRAGAERERGAHARQGVVKRHVVTGPDLLMDVMSVFHLFDHQAYEGWVLPLGLRQQAAEAVAEQPGQLQSWPGVCHGPERAGQLGACTLRQRSQRTGDLANWQRELPEVAFSVVDDVVGGCRVQIYAQLSHQPVLEDDDSQEAPARDHRQMDL